MKKATLKLTVDIKGRLIVLEVMSSVINDYGDPFDFLAREYIKEFDCMEDIIKLNTNISENEIVILDFYWNHEQTEYDSYFKEIKEMKCT